MGKWVLTAGHCCLIKDSDKPFPLMGYFGLQTESKARANETGIYNFLMKPKKMFVHPSYKYSEIAYDYCLLRFDDIFERARQENIPTTIKEKLIILKKRQDTPSKPVRQIVADVLIKHKIKTSRAVVQRILVKEEEIMKTAQSMNEVGQKRKRSMKNEKKKKKKPPKKKKKKKKKK